MTPEITPKRTFYLAGALSLVCHLVFAMTAGAYFLNREPPEVRREVRVKVIKKKELEKPEIRERKVQPKQETVPVVEPVKVPQPVQPQQRVQVASTAVPVTNVQPVQLDPVAAPSNAPAAKMVHSRSLTAVGTSAKPVRRVAVSHLPLASTHTVQPRTTAVRPVQTPSPVKVVSAPVPQVRGAVRTGPVSRTARVRGVTGVQAVAPVVNSAQPGPARPGVLSGRARARRLAGIQGVAPVQAPSAGTGGSAAVKAPPVKTRSRSVALPKAQAPVQVASLPPAPPGPVTDPEALEGYKSSLHRRLTFVAQRRYQRSTARRANQEGKVRVAFTVLRNGEVRNVHVKTPSRHAMLNQTALEAIKQAAPFKEFPEDIVEDELNLVIPFTFTLR